MRRDINLQELSKDHHHVLLFGWKLRKGLTNNTSREVLIDYIKYFVEKVLQPHCLVEENEVLSWLPNDNELKIRALVEHEILEKMVTCLDSGTEGVDEKILQIAEFVDSHVRFEERALFPYVETVLNTRQLGEIGECIKSSHNHVIDNYSHEFWKNNSH